MTTTTGLADWNEVHEALGVLRVGREQLDAIRHVGPAARRLTDRGGTGGRRRAPSARDRLRAAR